MEHKFNTQINQSGRLMKEFVDTVISFYQNYQTTGCFPHYGCTDALPLAAAGDSCTGSSDGGGIPSTAGGRIPKRLFDAASTLLCLHSKPGFSFVLDGRRDDQRL